jgi:hypothetical protein
MAELTRQAHEIEDHANSKLGSGSIATAIAAAENAAKSYADGVGSSAVSTASGDATTKSNSARDAAIAALGKPIICTAQFNGGSALPANTNTAHYYVVTTTGANATIGQLVYDNGTNTGTATVVAAGARVIYCSHYFTGGTVSLLGLSRWYWDSTTSAWMSIEEPDTMTRVAKLATSGSGTLADPYTGWDSSSIWQSEASSADFRGQVFANSTTWSITKPWFWTIDAEGATFLWQGGASPVMSHGVVSDDPPNYPKDKPLVFEFDGPCVIDGVGTYGQNGGAAATIGFELLGAYNFKVRGVYVRNATTCHHLNYCVTGNLERPGTFKAVMDPLVQFEPTNGLHAEDCYEWSVSDPEYFNVSGQSLWLTGGDEPTIIGGAFEGNTVGSSTIATSLGRFINTDLEGQLALAVSGGSNFFEGGWMPTLVSVSGNYNIFSRLAGIAVADTAIGSSYRDSGPTQYASPTAASTGVFDIRPLCMAMQTVGAGGDYWPGGRSTMFTFPPNGVTRLRVTLTAYCTAGPHAGDAHTWVLDSTFISVSGYTAVDTNAGNNNSAGTPPNSWTAAFFLGQGTGGDGKPMYYAQVAVAGSTSDTIEWGGRLDVIFNGGTGAGVNLLGLLKRLINNLGGFLWLATDATMPGDIMTVTGTGGASNLGAPSKGASPTIGTLADGTTPAIIVADENRILRPSATLGTSATNHTILAVGEPNNARNDGYIFYSDSGGSAWGMKTLFNFGGLTGPDITLQAGSSYVAHCNVAAGLQMLEWSKDLTNTVGKVYRNGVEVGTGSTSVSTTLAAYTSLSFFNYSGGSDGSPGAWPMLAYIPAALTAVQRAQFYWVSKALWPGLP